MYKHFYKRLLGIIISGIALLCIGWLLILVAIFFQERLGKDEKIFRVVMSKAMTDECDALRDLSHIRMVL